MRIRAGYDLVYDCPQPTPMILCLTVHPSRRSDLITPQTVRFTPPVEGCDYVDGFGNVCTRIVAPAGRTQISSSFEIEDSGRPDDVDWNAIQHPIEDLPDDVLVYLLGSRYCDTDRLGDIAWSQFGSTPPAGRGCRRSATSSTTTSASTTSAPTAPAQPRVRFRRASASAATSPISRSLSAGR